MKNVLPDDLETPAVVVDGDRMEALLVVRDIAESRLSVGDLVRVVPNHACPVTNLASEIVLLRDGAVADAWPVVARR